MVSLIMIDNRSPEVTGGQPIVAAAAQPFDLAAICASLGDRDAAFQWLDRAYERHIIWFLKVHPALDPLRGGPRYTELMKKTGL